MCTIFYQLQRYCGITILINFPLWRMSVVVGVGLSILTNAFLHICELDKYAHIVAHLHEPYACKEGYRQNAAQFNITIVGGRMCLIMPNGVDAQIVSGDISPPAGLLSSRFHKSQRKYKNGVGFYSKTLISCTFFTPEYYKNDS